MSTVITVENLGKKYLLSHQTQKQPYVALRDVIADNVKAFGRRFLSPFLGHNQSPVTSHRSQGVEDFWALKDVSFEVNQGDRIGIIGRNGAGKSTLLKILSRITEPTEGRVRIKGRVASLLEVGTGFHPELTGRENIFLNGAILGMTRAEIKKKFDEIVDFAEIEKFLDTPVKRYSSGMYVRLAFAVAAHLEPEILLVDEVLAVGDAQFQKKCLGKMEDVSKQEGRTILFVSHNMGAVRNLCGRVIWVRYGQTYLDGDSFSVIEAYLKDSLQNSSLDEMKEIIRSLPDDPVFRLNDVVISQDGIVTTCLANGSPIEIVITYTVMERYSGLRIYLDLYDEEGNLLIRTFNDDHATKISEVETGEYISKAVIPANFLSPREYTLYVRATIHNLRSLIGDGIQIPMHIQWTSQINKAYWPGPIRSKLQPEFAWTTEQIK